MPIKDDEKNPIKDEEKNPTERAGIPTSMNHELIQQALRASDTAAFQRKQASMDAVGRIEGSMYDTIGSMQLQTQRDISQRRMQALRQGTPSSGLAALELQNIQTAQMGAQQVQREFDAQRMELMTQHAGEQYDNRSHMAQTLAQNQIQASAIEAERLPHDWSASIESLYGEGAMDDLTPSEKMALRDRFDAAVDNDDINQNLLNSAFSKMGAGSGQTTFEAAKESFNKLYEGTEIADKVKVTDKSIPANADLSMFSEIGARTGKGGRQDEWISHVQTAVRDGSIKDGDIINLNYGFGRDHVMYQDGQFIKLESGYLQEQPMSQMVSEAGHGYHSAATRVGRSMTSHGTGKNFYTD